MSLETTNKPAAVIISDIHYSLQTLEVADKSLRMAIEKAEQLNVPLIIAGDLHDSKANLRAECINTILLTFSLHNRHPFVLVGNHDLCNEKGQTNALGFLDKSARVISSPTKFGDWYFMPYQSSADRFKELLDNWNIPKGSIIFCHQGIIDSNAGHYIQDKSAIPKEWLKWYRVISGHYHTRQSIECGPLHGAYVGQFDYVGNPYTLNFSEANDPEKGFQILYEDGSLEFVPTNLRRHQIIEYTLGETKLVDIKSDDIVWIKIHGPSDELAKIRKYDIAKIYGLSQDFKLDLIPIETLSGELFQHTEDSLQPEILDNLIDGLQNTDDGRKLRLKTLWKNLIGG